MRAAPGARVEREKRRPAGKAGGAAAAQRKRVMRERRNAEKRRAYRIRFATLATVAAVVMTAGMVLYRSSAFSIKRVEVEGTARLTEKQVLTLARVPEDSTLLRFPGREVKARLLKDPWVADASVTRDFPDGMRIRVTERRPAALLDLGESLWMVDSSAFVLARKALEESSTLVVVRDVEGARPKVGSHVESKSLDNALAVLGGLSSELRGKVRAVRAPLIDETALLTTDGVEILIGEAVDVSKKDYVARKILQEQAGRVVFIDVRTIDRPVWRGL